MKFGEPFSWDKISPELEVEETLNDSDKTISVPTGEEWKILWIQVYFAATGTVGTRRLLVEFRDGADDVILYSEAIETVAANGVGQYLWMTSITNAAGPWYGKRVQGIPPDAILKAGYDLRIRDLSAVDAAADDMDIQMMVKKRKT